MKPETPLIRLAICLPWTNSVDARFARCLAEMYGSLGAKLIEPGFGDVNIFDVNGTYVDKSREELTRAAIKWGATHLLWLDSDMVFPDWAPFHLLKRNVDIVACNYARRRAPHSPVTFKKLGDNTKGGENVLCYTTDDSTGMEEVDACGFGVVLMRSNIFEKILPPAFETCFDRDTQAWVGEDVKFCLNARRQGYQVWIDHDLSKYIGHMGVYEFRNEASNVMRSAIEEVTQGMEAKLRAPQLVRP